MRQFPNKMIEQAYTSIDGKVLFCSPTRKLFIDQDDCSDYDYHAVQWLIDNGLVVQLKYDPTVSYSMRWKRKDQL